MQVFCAYGIFYLLNKTKTEVIEKGEELANLAVLHCFDFNDSCGGSWEACHENVSTEQLIDFVYDWDVKCYFFKNKKILL
ncbi:hypothetical protein [Chishuiella sp.]|uniref:hypothetical protein n=1 Tax=Chishuiella sp. TaxID=1969467 RepID=UPI0028AFAF36|nr:hypothetical protein [Chishuiella sp.]